MFPAYLGSWAKRALSETAARNQARTALATAVAGAFALVGGATLLSSAESSHAGAPHATFSERFSGKAAADCSAAWPYLHAACLRTPDGSRVRPARIITTDQRGSGARMLQPSR